MTAKPPKTRRLLTPTRLRKLVHDLRRFGDLIEANLEQATPAHRRVMTQTLNSAALTTRRAAELHNGYEPLVRFTGTEPAVDTLRCQGCQQPVWNGRDDHPWHPACRIRHLERDAMRDALLTYEAAWEAMFIQCGSNGMKDAWGNPVKAELLNAAHQAAERALKKAPVQS